MPFLLRVKSKYYLNPDELVRLCTESSSWAVELLDPATTRPVAVAKLVESEYGTIKCEPCEKEAGLGPEIIFLTPALWKCLNPRALTSQNSSLPPTLKPLTKL